MTVRKTEKVIHKGYGSITKITVTLVAGGKKVTANFKNVTRMVLKLFNTDNGDIVIDSDVSPTFLTWDNKGQVFFDLGGIEELVLGEYYTASLVVYDPLHTAGQHITSPCSNEVLEFYVCSHV